MTDLGYDYRNPVVYDNDDHRDVYTDEYLLALASAGEITLAGMITTYTHDRGEYAEFVDGRREIVAKARRSGMKHLPDPVAGPDHALVRPADGRPESTAPIDAPGSRLIVQQARTASPELPLVVICGGPLTAVADAYLLDPSIADRVIVAALLASPEGLYGWNCGIDLWAAEIVAARMRLVIFPESTNTETAARVPKSALSALPESELREWMIEKQHPTNFGPWDRDADGQPAVALMRGDYACAVRRVSLDGYDGEVPRFGDDPDGAITIVTDADADIATEEFFRALTNPAAYSR